MKKTVKNAGQTAGDQPGPQFVRPPGLLESLDAQRASMTRMVVGRGQDVSEHWQKFLDALDAELLCFPKQKH